MQARDFHSRKNTADSLYNTSVALYNGQLTGSHHQISTTKLSGTCTIGPFEFVTQRLRCNYDFARETRWFVRGKINKRTQRFMSVGKDYEAEQRHEERISRPNIWRYEIFRINAPAIIAI